MPLPVVVTMSELTLQESSTVIGFAAVAGTVITETVFDPSRTVTVPAPIGVPMTILRTQHGCGQIFCAVAAPEI